MRNDQVIDAWQRGVIGVSHSGNLLTNGVDLYSYKLRIGHRTSTGATVLGDYTSGGGRFYSVTTSCHVGKARMAADHIMHPAVFEATDFGRS